VAGEKDTLTIFLYDLYGNAIVTNPGLRVALTFKVRRCRLTVSTPVLKAPMITVLETQIS